MKEVFCSGTMALILAIPISLNRGDDVLLWAETTSGVYSSKSSYCFICNFSTPLEASS